MVSRTKQDRYPINGSLQRIVDTRPESPTDISDLPITIDGGQEPETVDYQAILIGQVILVHLLQTDGRTF